MQHEPNGLENSDTSRCIKIEAMIGSVSNKPSASSSCCLFSDETHWWEPLATTCLVAHVQSIA